MKKTRKSTSHSGHTAVGDTIRHAGDKTDEWIHKGQDMSSNLQKEVNEYTDTLADYIKKHPFKSSLIAGGVGMLLGFLLKK